MATRGEVSAIPAAPTDLRRYAGYAVAVTFLIAGFPLWVALTFGARYGGFASLVSVALSIGLAQIGNRMWQRHPGSRDIVFNDLMMWGFVRRLRSQRGVSDKAKRLGLISKDAQTSKLTLDERVRVLKKLAVALEDGDPYTHGHSQRVAHHSYMIAKAMRLPRREQEKIRLAGLVHDVGKLHVSKEIINKPGFLNDEEYEAIKTHSAIGAEMVAILDDPEITRMVREHHERLDGTGYPDNLNGSEICLGARIIAVADTFDATSSQRPYRDARPHKEAMDILKRESKERLDPVVVDAFTGYYSGRRAMKWWAVGSIAPAHLRELALVMMQRIGTAGVANAAVVGATALALTPISATRPATPQEGRAKDNRPAVVRRAEDRPSVLAHVAVSTGIGESPNGDLGRSADKRRDQKGHNGSNGRRKGQQRDEGGHSKGPNDKGNDSAPSGAPSHSNAGGKDKDPKDNKPPKDPEVADFGSPGGVAGAVSGDESPALEEPAAPEPDAPGNSDNAPGQAAASEPAEVVSEPADDSPGNGNGNANGHSNGNGNGGGKDK